MEKMLSTVLKANTAAVGGEEALYYLKSQHHKNCFSAYDKFLQQMYKSVL